MDLGREYSNSCPSHLSTRSLTQPLLQQPFHGTGFAASPVTITTIQTYHGQSCYNDQSGMDNRNDRQQCDIGNRCSQDYINRSPSSISQCFGANEQDGGGDGYGPGAGFLKTRQSRPTHSTAMNWGATASASWQLKNDAQQFYVALENGESHGDTYNGAMENIHPEMVGWAAFTEHHGSMGEFTYEAGRTPLAVTEQPYTIQFSGFFRAAPKLYANIATYHGTNSAELRRAGDTPITSAGALLAVQVVKSQWAIIEPCNMPTVQVPPS